MVIFLEDQPLEIVYLIASHLNFRSLICLKRTCRTYSELLDSLIESRKKELFAQHTFADDENGIVFYPGPAIKHLPKNFPLDGIYFFDMPDYHASCNVQFFLLNFDKFLRSDCLDTQCIATIKTKTKKIHNHDLGCHNLSRSDLIGHYNDLDVAYGDYRSLFHVGKTNIKEFWRAL